VSTTQNITQYTYSAGPGGTTEGGTQFGVNLGITVEAGTDFTDADSFAIQSALAAAFPESWGVVADDISLTKAQVDSTFFTTNLESDPPSFT
jgi:hypothetical protein